MDSSKVNIKKRALISVFDKSNLLPFVHSLVRLGFEIVSTGGTAQTLKDKNIPVTLVSDITQQPEIMGGRVKTLHPKIYASILARSDHTSDIEELQKMNMTQIELVVVNLYPFVEVVNRGACSEEIIENIDIGGPTMIRAAAKNHSSVMVVVNPNDYDLVLEHLAQHKFDKSFNFSLAATAFSYTAVYDNHIQSWFAEQKQESKENQSELPKQLTINAKQKQLLRYGENPHQKAAFYRLTNAELSIADIEQLQGKELSYNNIMDSDAALKIVSQKHNNNCCVIIKHANPCGVAIADTVQKSYELAFETDKISAFGGIIAFNANVCYDTVEKILENQFFEIIVAPSYEEKALTLLLTKKNVRVLRYTSEAKTNRHEWHIRQVMGGILYQQKEYSPETKWTVVTQNKPNQAQLIEAYFAWNVVRFVKSNAIVLTAKGQTIGIGVGQTSRITSVQLASSKARETFTLEGSTLASDGFFPFKDSIENAAKDGIQLIVQPGGSICDEEIISCANKHSIIMIFTHHRCFTH